MSRNIRIQAGVGGRLIFARLHDVDDKDYSHLMNLLASASRGSAITETRDLESVTLSLYRGQCKDNDPILEKKI